MSRIYFHMQDEDVPDVEIGGPERHWANSLCSDLVLSVLGLNHFPDAKRFLPLIRADHYVAQAPPRMQGQWLATAAASFDRVFADFDNFELKINTAIAVGGDVLRFLARMHGSCEIHGYVEHDNRRWLAGIIAEGREIGLLRSRMGWERLVEALEQGQGPVVMSYSVTDQFPNAHVAGWTPIVHDDGEKDYEAFYELPWAERWRRSMDALREENASLTNGYELKPEGWSTWRCGAGHTAFDVLAATEKP